MDATTPEESAGQAGYRTPISLSIGGLVCFIVGAWLLVGGSYHPVMDGGLLPDNFERFAGGLGLAGLGLLLLGSALVIAWKRRRKNRDDN